MQDQPIGESLIQQDNDKDWSVLSTLLIDNETPWTVDELIVGHGSGKVWVIDSLGRLERGGLIRRTADGLIFPTRAAVYFDQLHG